MTTLYIAHVYSAADHAAEAPEHTNVFASLAEAQAYSNGQSMWGLEWEETAPGVYAAEEDGIHWVITPAPLGGRRG